MSETHDFHELRRSLGMKQSEIARKSRMAASVLSEWERGNILSPRYAAMVHVAEAMSVPVTTLAAAVAESYYRKHPDARPLELAPAA